MRVEMGTLGRVRARCDDALEHLAIPIPDRMQDARALAAPNRKSIVAGSTTRSMGDLHELGAATTARSSMRSSSEVELVRVVVGVTPSRLSLAARAVLSTSVTTPVSPRRQATRAGGAKKTCVRPACSVFAAFITGTRALRHGRRTSLVDTRQLAVQGDEPRLDTRCERGDRRRLRSSEVDAHVGELVEQGGRLTVPVRLGLLPPGAADEPGDDAADDDHCDQHEQPRVAVVVLVDGRCDGRGRRCRVGRRGSRGRGRGRRGRRRRGRGWRCCRGLGRRGARRVLCRCDTAHRANQGDCAGDEQCSNGARHARDRTRPSRLPRPPPRVG